MRTLPLLLAVLFIAIVVPLHAAANLQTGTDVIASADLTKQFSSPNVGMAIGNSSAPVKRIKRDVPENCIKIESGRQELANELSKCKEGATKCENTCKESFPTGALVGLSLVMVLFFLLFVLVLVDAFFLNKLFKRAGSGSDE